MLTSKSGTLAYLAPEVYAGNGYDFRADWWSLGVLFYECIYNKVRPPLPPCARRSRQREARTAAQTPCGCARLKDLALATVRRPLGVDA